jgi:Ni/Fe-hydrogenase subunit HybB-like protein
MRIVLVVLSSVGAVVLVAVGVASVKWYVWDIVIGQAGESDRSMLFWGLPILFIGIFAVTAAGGLAFAAVRLSLHHS